MAYEKLKEISNLLRGEAFNDVLETLKAYDDSPQVKIEIALRLKDLAEIKDPELVRFGCRMFRDSTVISTLKAYAESPDIGIIALAIKDLIYIGDEELIRKAAETIELYVNMPARDGEPSIGAVIASQLSYVAKTSRSLLTTKVEFICETYERTLPIIKEYAKLGLESYVAWKIGDVAESLDPWLVDEFLELLKDKEKGIKIASSWEAFLEWKRKMKLKREA